MPDDEDRKAILARRNRLVALALSGLASASTGCYDSHGPGDLPPTRGDAGVDAATPGPCLGRPIDDDASIPGPCLGAPLDAGTDDAGADDAGADDAGVDAGVIPGPCLSAPS